MKLLDFRKYFLTLVSLVFVFFDIRAQSGVWTKIGDMPESRYGHTVDEINGKVYVIGGAVDEVSAYPTHSLIYDRLTAEWSQMNLYNNSVRGAHNSCVVDGKLYVVGGNDGVRTVATMEMFDPNTGEWTAKMPMPTDRGLAACASIEGKIYIIGGIRGSLNNLDWGGLNKVEAYDTKNDTWIQVADMPSRRWGHSATAANGKIYVFGGRSSGNPYGSIEVYDPHTNKWTTNPKSMLTPRYCLSTCLLDSNIYIIGGWFHSSYGPLYDKVEVYNPILDEWKSETPFPVKRAVLTSIVIDGKIYVYGGSCTTHPNYGTSEIYEFSNNEIFAIQSCIDRTYARKDLDSVLFRTGFSNIYNHLFTPHLIYSRSDSLQADSLSLFDDGQHGDLLSDDGIYGNYIQPQARENFFNLSVSTFDSEINKYFCTQNECKFATVGPVILDIIDISYSQNSNDYKVKPYIYNQSATTTITKASIKLICDDPWIKSINVEERTLPDIPPGSTKKPSSSFIIECDESLFSGYFNFKVEILTDGCMYWTDSNKTIVTEVEEENLQPLIFKLNQNYPNPFNPSTVIIYQLAVGSQVTLKIYDVLGNEVATLINEEKPAGSYEVTWNAANLPSGVYFYQLKSGSYTATKKLLLMK